MEGGGIEKGRRRRMIRRSVQRIDDEEMGRGQI